MLNKEKNTNIVIFSSCILLIIIVSVIPNPHTTIINADEVYELTPDEERDFQSNGVNVRNKYSNDLWWITNKTEPIKTEYENVAVSIQRLRQKDESELSKTFGSIYVNPHNNTIFILITDTSLQSINTISEEIGKTDEVTIIFRKAAVTYRELETYEKVIYNKWSSLKEKGALVTAHGITENATIIVELVSVNKLSVNALISKLPEIPRELLVIRKGNIPDLYGQRDYTRPLVSGIEMDARQIAAYEPNYGTMGFLGYDNYARSGFLGCEHHLVDAAHVYQDTVRPGMPYSGEVGRTIIHGSGTYADCAWTIIWQGDISYNLNIYSSGTPIEVWSHMHYNDIVVGTSVRFTGIASGTKTGSISRKGAEYNDYFGRQLLNQVRVSQTAQVLDSGSPVYTRTYHSPTQRYRANAYGMLWGGDASQNRYFFSPVDGIEADLGLSLVIEYP